MVDAIIENFAMRGWGLWAVEVIDGAPFVGFVGLNVPGFETVFTPCVEIGWRLAREHWGKGYASEAARAALQHGFEDVGLDEILSWTATTNLPSQAVMARDRHDARSPPMTSIIPVSNRDTRSVRTCCTATRANRGLRRRPDWGDTVVSMSSAARLLVIVT